jgi:hypothetical protein
MDPLEEDMGVRCEQMSADQLIAYIKGYHAAFDLNLKISGMPERSALTGLQRTYGKTDAGKIIKWVFYHHKGRHNGEPVTPLSFSKGRKWWTDKMHLEMQEATRITAPADYASAATDLGIRSLADL